MKRKSTESYPDIPGFPVSKRLSAESPAARRPMSLSLSMPSPTQQPQRSPCKSYIVFFYQYALEKENIS